MSRGTAGTHLGRVVAAAVLALGALVVPGARSATAAPPDVTRAFEVRSVYTGEFGIARPSGVTFTPDDQALVVAGEAGNATSLARFRGEDLLSAAILPAAEPSTLAFDETQDQLAVVAGEGLLTVPESTLSQPRPQSSSAPIGATNVAAPAGAMFDPAGALVVLDAHDGALVRVEGDDSFQTVTRTDLPALAGTELRGVAYNDAERRIYVGSPGERRLYGVDAGGAVQSIIDLADAALVDPQSFTFAPSADPTDDPSRLSVYVADAGTGADDGRVVEMSLVAPAALALTPEPAVLVQTINAFEWAPPSPDTSGIAYVPESDELIVSDSEVEEMPIYEGVNLFETTRTGTLVGTGDTTAFSNEPTGLSYRSSDQTLFVSDDNANRITLVRPGPDQQHGTSDDVRSFFSTLPFSDDPEDVAYDALSGDVFIVDGVGTEVYRVNPGPNGVFGNSDDVWTNFDVGVHGARDPEGIEHNAATNTLLVVDQGSRAIYELTPTGVLLRIIDIRPADTVAAADVAVAPGSLHPDRTNYWVVARGVDNGPDPDENDGKIYELSVGSGGNSLPVVDSVVIDQPAPKTNDTLTVTVAAHDPDGDAITLRYVWRKNGTAIPGQTAPTLDLSVAGNGDKGDAISVRVTAFDGIVESAPRTSGQVTVGNSPPVFDGNLPNRADTEGSTVSISAAATDADGDALTYGADGLPTGITINAATGLLSGTIAAGAASGSPYDVSVTVREGSVPDAVDTFVWTVNVPPVLPVVVPGGLGVLEGNTGTKTVNVPFTLSAPASTTVTVDYATLDNTAQAPDDYVATSGTLTFVPGDTQEIVPVTVKGDLVHEPQELFLVSLSNAQGATIGGFFGLAFVFVNNDDPIPVVTPGVVRAPEGDAGSTAVSVPFTLDRPSSSTVTVDYITLDHSASAGQDYQATSGTLTFPAGATQANVTVNVNGDVAPEPEELFLVSLRNPTGAKIGGFWGLGFVFIVDDD